MKRPVNSMCWRPKPAPNLRCSGCAAPLAPEVTSTTRLRLFIAFGALYEKENCVTPNPYAPPKAEVAEIAGERISPPLWNPNAAANWSLLFSPAFGAFLHMRNWQALGQPSRATSAKIWFVLSLVTIGGLSCASVVVPDSKQLAGSVRLVGFLLLLAWYFGSARSQASYVKTHFGNTYARRGWLKPLAVAVLVLFTFIVVVTGAAMLKGTVMKAAV
jgi:hypothetical protein